jgi:hypothetical protein
MPNYITTGYVFWYPTQSLDSNTAGVVNDPDRKWFITATPSSLVTNFWRVSGSLAATQGTPINDYGLTFATGSELATTVFKTAQETNGPSAYEGCLGGQAAQSALYSVALNNRTGSTILPSFFFDTAIDGNYDFSLGGGIIILTGSYVIGPESGLKDIRWYWTAEDNSSNSGSYSPNIYVNPEDQADFLIRTFGAADNGQGGEQKLAGAVASIGGIFLAPRDLGGGEFILDIPTNFKPGGSYPIYKFVVNP